MKAAPFEYHAPETVETALDLLNRLPDAKILAGGQSLIPMMNFRYALPEHLIDIGRIEDLRRIALEGTTLRVGAGVRQHELLDNAIVRDRLPVIARALELVGHVQTRNRGTVGGSLCHLDPAAELPLLALALDAEMVVAARGGKWRRVPAMAWATGYMAPACGPDELLSSIEIALPDPMPGWGFEEFSRRHGDYAIVAAVALATRDAEDGDRIGDVRLALAGAMERPIRLTVMEDDLRGQAVDEGPAIAREAAASIETMSDAYYSAEYRRRLAGVLVQRALRKALHSAPASAHAIGPAPKHRLVSRLLGRAA